MKKAPFDKIFFQIIMTIDNWEYIDCSLARPACLFWLSDYVAYHCLAVAPQSSAKDQFYSIAHYITLNQIC